MSCFIRDEARKNAEKFLGTLERNARNFKNSATLTLSTRDERLTSEITTLQAALAKAREENDASREREAKLQSQCESSATRFDALQKRTKQLMKEAERDRSEVSVSRKQIQDLQAKCASLQEGLTLAVEESEARKQHEQIMVQQMNEKLALEQNYLARDEQLTSEITTLRAALAEAREENASRREREAKLQSQCESSATMFDALQKRTKQLMKEAERDRSEVSVSRKQIQDLQAKCASLQEGLTLAVEESEARKQYEQILVQQMNEKLALEQNHLREIDNERKAKYELAERCEQLQLQVNAYEEDFKAERRDRERAHDTFADKEKKWMEQLENLTQERDRLTGNILTLKDQLVARKREVPMVACNDKEGTASDGEYKSMETTDATTNVGAGVPPKSATPSAAEGEERHHQHHETTKLENRIRASDTLA